MLREENAFNMHPQIKLELAYVIGSECIHINKLIEPGISDLRCCVNCLAYFGFCKSAYADGSLCSKTRTQDVLKSNICGGESGLQSKTNTNKRATQFQAPSKHMIRNKAWIVYQGCALVAYLFVYIHTYIPTCIRTLGASSLYRARYPCLEP